MVIVEELKSPHARLRTKLHPLGITNRTTNKLSYDEYTGKMRIIQTKGIFIHAERQKNPVKL